jgi:hypothetical protein
MYALTTDRERVWRFDPEPALDVLFSPTLADGVAYVGTSDADGAAILAVRGDRQ